MPNSLINQNNVNALVDRCRQDVDNGLLPSCQVALGFRGELILDETIGNASADSRYCFFSLEYLLSVFIIVFCPCPCGYLNIETPSASTVTLDEVPFS